MASLKHPVPAVVEIHWEDAYVHHGWGDRKQRLKSDMKTAQIRSVGYLVEDNKAGVKIAISVNAADDIDETLFIPRSRILRQRQVAAADKRWNEEDGAFSSPPPVKRE